MPAKTAPKRSKHERERDLEEISALYLDGWTQAKIAVKLKLSRSQIEYDIRSIQTRWRKSSIRNFDEAKQRELTRIDAAERNAWEGWQRSHGKMSEKTKQVKEGATPAESFDSETEKTWQEAGDPRFLDVVLKCVQQRAKLLGLDAPTKMEHSGPDGGPIETAGKVKLSELTDEQLRAYEAFTSAVRGAGPCDDAARP